MSATADEPVHITSGYLALKEGDHRFDPTHPPFLRMWQALPLAGRPMPGVDAAASETMPYAEWTQSGYRSAQDFLLGGAQGDSALRAARMMNLAWGALLGVLVFAWCLELFGLAPAAFVLALAVGEPNLSTHASLATTDAGIACFYFGSAYFLWRVVRSFSPGNVAGLAMFTGLAVVSKFSAVLLAPVILLLLLAAVIRRTLTVRRALTVAVIVFATSVAAIWGVYGFRHAPGEAAKLIQAASAPVVQERAPALASALGWIDAHRLLPNAFTQGFLLTQASSEALPTYIRGNVITGGSWQYFPLAFLWKTPEILLAFSVLGLGALLNRNRVGRPLACRAEVPRRRVGRRSVLHLLLPPLLYAAFAAASGINIGLRHILPVYPFALVFAAAGAAAILAFRARWARVTTTAATLVALASAMAARPHTLAYFNAIAGGPSQGSRYLSDSNQDWGQELKALKRWMDAAGVSRINLAYFGTVDPAKYGIEGPLLPGSPAFKGIAKPELPGYVAVSETIANGVYLPPAWRLFYAGFQDKEPVAIIGHAIRIHRLDEWPFASGATDSAVGPPLAERLSLHLQLADSLLFDMDWPQAAIPHLRFGVTRDPANGPLRAKLGLALLQSGQRNEAIAVMRQAAAEPMALPGRVRAEIAMALLKHRETDEALSHAQAAAVQAPEDAQVQDALGIILASIGRVEEATAAFQRAARLDPTSRTIQDHLRQVLERR